MVLVTWFVFSNTDAKAIANHISENLFYHMNFDAVFYQIDINFWSFGQSKKDKHSYAEEQQTVKEEM